MENLDALREELLSAVGGVDSLDALEELRVSALGRKGRVTELMKGLGGLAPRYRSRTARPGTAGRGRPQRAVAVVSRAV